MIHFKQSKDDSFLRFWLQNKARHYIQGWFLPTTGEWCIEFAINDLVTDNGSVRGSFGGCMKGATENSIKQWLEAIIEIVAPKFAEEMRT